MPLFFNKFSPKKTPTRKASVFLANKNLSPKRIEKELGPEVGPIRLHLGDQEAVFEAGLWIPESGKAGGTFKENEKLKKEVRRLEEENNLLKLKFDVLLDMVIFFYVASFKSINANNRRGSLAERRIRETEK
ncbi:protein chibby homolog 1 isoform X1 [Temnothorax curvispinosus]|uniref:Protein chibby homolog 1 isoform X1 n=1 Tax=Temnothorax curvispinosus TaxID=300111 RepID=A0A6J1PW03_9HYME|nr:protein chibby homolog 1 isoform X1 [Temnothorax curvispinosus]